MSAKVQVLCLVFLVLQKCDGKNKKKQFRETVCRLFVAQLKPYYQAGKFKSNVSFLPGGTEEVEGTGEIGGCQWLLNGMR